MKKGRERRKEERRKRKRAGKGEKGRNIGRVFTLSADNRLGI